ncbi:NAD(P)-dependent oxidoreductase [Enterococcus sp. HY326]|uniref:NAD(P)-dependent oxidoreductase n=1 Tax=Enterococcus sp. HY326 TaxID=2971265 RepID=UPI0022406858|nr:NAD(P)-dependent oxidoreductase [Enterococcus sp. HY326]
MKIALIGATGHAGSEILKEAVSRNLDVTAIVRSPERLKLDVPYLKKDLFALTQEDLAPFDVVVDAFRAPNGHEELHKTSVEHLVKILTGTKTRLLVIGGTSSLFIDEDRSERMIDGVDPSAPFYPTAYNMYEALVDLKKANDLTWTYVSPAAYFNPNGTRTGHYQLSDDRMKMNSQGQSEISMADYAIAMVDEIEKPQHLNEHISVVSQ